MYARKMIVIGILMGCVLSLGTGCQRQGQSLPPQAEAALHYYLNVDCRVGEKRPEPLSDLLKIERTLDADGKKVLRTRLEKLLTEGPDKEIEAEIEREAKEEFVQEHAFFKANQSNQTLGLMQEDLKIVLAETQKEYVDENLQLVKRKYKERAGIALYAIDPKAAEDTLRRLDEKERAELQKVIRAAFSRQPRTLQRPAARTPAP